jgi:hypothetical protein
MAALSRRLQDYFWRDSRVSELESPDRSGSVPAPRAHAQKALSDRDRAGACGLAAVAVALSVRRVDSH